MGFIHLAPSKVQKPIFFDLCFVLTIEFEQNYPNIYSSFIILEIWLYNHCLRVGEVLKSIAQKLKTRVSNAKSWTQDELIKNLNQIIRGWANYHRHIVAKDTFKKLDSYIWEITWRWGKRRHPNKGHKWIFNKYWIPECPRKWVFQTKETKLLQFSDFQIRRHSMPKLDANPYLDRSYFLERKNRIKKQTPWIQTRFPFFSSFEAAWKGCEMRERTAVKVARFVPGREGKSNLSFLFNGHMENRKVKIRRGRDL